MLHIISPIYIMLFYDLGNTHHSNILPIFIKLKKAMKIVCKVKFVHHTSELFANMKLLNFC